MKSRLTNFEKSLKLYDMGFYVGIRDQKRNTMFPGNFMVAENIIDYETVDSSDGGGWCIVGDDLTSLINETYNHFVFEKDEYF